jgi:carbon monoxide dehydrogenase subunit G
MIRIEESITIDRPVEEVFTFLTDIDHQSDWVSLVEESHKLSSEPTAVGTKYRQVAKLLGRRLDATNEVTAYEPPHVFEFRGKSGPAEVQMRFTLTEEGSGTRVLQSAEGETGGVFKLVDPMVARTMKKQFAADLETLKTLLEGGIAEDSAE